jgi:hypothetical protein
MTGFNYLSLDRLESPWFELSRSQPLEPLPSPWLQCSFPSFPSFPSFSSFPLPVPPPANTWGPGSRWDYKLTPTTQGGTEIEVTVERRGKGLKGRLIELGLAAAGAGMLRSQMEQALPRSASAG